jgi:thiosulfate reductase cytochrome b subunit
MATDEGERTGHSHVVRMTHWVTTVAFLALVVSGYVITMTHPRLYWGDVGNIYMPAWIELPIERKLGESGWGRSLHFLSAWILVMTGMIYIVWGLAARHFTRDLVPRRTELDRAHVRQEVTRQLRWRIHKDGPVPHYGLAQKAAYLVVVFVLVPLVVLTGLALSPAVTAAYPLLRLMFGGHQSARTIHFLDSVLLLLFVIGHVIMVVRSGFWRQIRAMTIGERSYAEHAHLATQAVGDRR